MFNLPYQIISSHNGFIGAKNEKTEITSYRLRQVIIVMDEQQPLSYFFCKFYNDIK